MTPQLIFWLRIGVYALIAYNLFTFVKDKIRHQYLIPKNKKEWVRMGGDLFSIFLGFFLLFIINRNFQAPVSTVMAYRQKALPSFAFQSMASNEIKTPGEYSNKIVILNLWATWCGPCRKELPDLDKLQAENSKNLAVIAISDESPEIVKAFLKNHNFHLETGILIGRSGFLDSIQTRPVSILIDSKGYVQDMVVGARGYSFFQKWIKPLMSKE